MTVVNAPASGSLKDLSNAQAAGSAGSLNVDGLVAFALRQAYLENTEDLKMYAEKVKFHNELKKEIRDELARMREVQATLAGCYNEDGSVNLEKLMEKPAPGAVDYEGSIPSWGKTNGEVNARFWVDNQLRQCWGGGVKEFGDSPGPDGKPSSTVGDGADQWWGPGGKELLDTAVKNMEDKLSSVGDDAQLANVDLQNSLQKQQQTMQQLSNILKMCHDTAMATIRKIGG